MSKESKEEIFVSLQQKYDFVSMSDIERPTSDFMMNYFYTVLSNFGIDLQIIQPQNLQNSDLLKEYKDIFPYVQLRMIILKVFPIPEYMNFFSVLSLMDPRPNDIQFVEVMENYNEFFERVLYDMLEPKLRRIEQMKEETKQLEKEKATLTTHLSDWDAVRGRRAISQAKADEQLIELSAAEVRLSNQLQQLEADVSDQQLLEGLEREWQELEELEAKYETQRQYDLISTELLQLQVKQQKQERLLSEKRDLRQEKKSRLHLFEKGIEEMSQVLREIEEVLATDSAIKEMDTALVQDLLKKETMQKEYLKAEREEAAGDLTMALEEIATIESNIIVLKQKKADVDKSIEELRLSQLKTNQELIYIQEEVKSAAKIISNDNESYVAERNYCQKSLQELHEAFINRHMTLERSFSGNE